MGSAAAERERNAAKVEQRGLEDIRARSNDRRRGFEKEQRLKPTTNSRTRRSTCAQRITPVRQRERLLTARRPGGRSVGKKVTVVSWHSEIQSVGIGASCSVGGELRCD
ncbi:hypothetical protein Tsp_01883 [Trichinella spiralis]|uniref:hypothetical protein n=1 Tax=Trichinella spiralis TaxID=6334 RepID=UPI0001EFB2F5|nr:hypothetical protein Tsp_01883 [Trichinella spiralis]